MKETLLASYERKSTLWKNANAFYVSQDWTKMDCIFRDYSEERQDDMFHWIDRKTGEDITEKVKQERFCDWYCIVLTNKRGTSKRCFSYKTKEEANEMFKAIRDHKHLSGWIRTV